MSAERRPGKLQKTALLQEYLSRLPLALVLLSVDGEVLFATEDGLRQYERWNRGLSRAPATSAQTIIDAIRQDVAGEPRTLGHPCIRQLQVQLEECRYTPRGQIAGCWLTFFERAPVAEAAAGSSLLALRCLSRGERRVASLAAQGLSNGQIADIITRSVRTVEYQLSRVYRKMGLRGRTQLALALAGLAGVAKSAA